MLPIRLHGWVFINGFPGAGNVIMTRICEEILQAAKAPVNKEVRLAMPLAERSYGDESPLLYCIADRYNQFGALLRQALPEGWAGDAYFQNRSGGRVDFMAFKKPAFLMVTGIDLGTHLNSQIHSSHELPSVENYAAYDTLGYHIIPMVRHPLDMIVSYVSKGAVSENAMRLFTEFSETLETPEQKDAAYRTFRKAIRWLGMKDERHLRVITEAVRDYYAPVAQMREQFPPLRYVDLLADPVKTISGLAERLGVCLDQKSLENIARLIGNTALAPHHFNDPRCGKWRTYFPRVHYDMIVSTGLFEIFSAFGYELPARDALPEIDYEVVPEQYRMLPDAILCRGELFTLNMYAGLINIFDPIALARQFGVEVHSVQHGRFTLVSNDSELMRRFSANLTEGILHALNRR